MATPCIRLPREHGRRDGCASHAQAAFRKNLKELVRDHLHTCIALSARGDGECSEFCATEMSSCCDSLQHPGNEGGFWTSDEEASNAYDQALSRSAAAALSRRQSRMLDRWAAKQARVMITTIENQAREAELSVLSRGHVGTATGQSFQRETSPTSSDSSLEQPHLRASSLVQMWREFESEGRRTRTENHGKSMCSAPSSGNLHPGTSTLDNFSIDGRSEVCDSELSEMDWESDRTPRHQHTSPRDRDAKENERVRVADMVRKLTTGEGGQSSLTTCGDATADHEPFSPREPPASPVASSKRNGVGFPSIKNPPRFRGRLAIQDFLDRMERERKTELASLAERHAVSQCSNRSRIQVLLRFQILQRDVVAHAQPPAASTVTELDQLFRGSSIIQLREKFNSRKQHDGSPTKKVLATCARRAFVDFRNNSMKSEISCVSAVSTANTEFFDATPREHEITEFNALQSVGEVLHEEEEEEEEEEVGEGIQEEEAKAEKRSPIDDWKERIVLHGPQSSDVIHRNHEIASKGTQPLEYAETESLQEAAVPSFNIPWQGTAESAECSPIWEGDILMEESDSDNQQDVRHAAVNWVSNESHPPREASAHRGCMYNDWLERISDNKDICNLLQKRTVSTLLASDFRQIMDRLVLSLLERQGNYSFADDSIDEYEGQQLDIRTGHEIGTDDQSLYTSVQLPLPSSRLIHQQQNQQDSSLTHQSSTHSIEMELIYELRRDMERILQEVSELRKSVASCKEVQRQMQDCPKQEDSPACIQSSQGIIDVESSPMVLTSKVGCCICYEMQVDSLLYRCGHMCTCYKCACELQMSTGICPICAAPIIDVVRANF